MMNAFKPTRHLSALLASVAAQSFTPALAQSAPQELASAESENDIIVTANRREERLQKVGISVTAVGGDLITENNIFRAEDLGKLAPGVTGTSQSGTTVATFVIRGVGQADFNSHQEQPIATYQDGVYIPVASATGFPLFDLQRVEVLRGPQGTLFGRNATGGLIQYLSMQPKAGMSGAVESALGSRDLRRVQGHLNGGNDTVAGRLAFFYQDQKGYLINRLGRDEGDRESFALRGQIRLQLGDSTVATLRGEGFNQDGTSGGSKPTPAFRDAQGVSQYLPADVDAYGTGPGNDLYGYRNTETGLAVSLNSPGEILRRSRTAALTIVHEFDRATLTSVTAAGWTRERYSEDTDFSPLDQTSYSSSATGRYYSQELRLNGSIDHFRYTLGGYAFQVSGDYKTQFNIPTLITYDPATDTGTGASSLSDYRLKTTSFAIFGQVEYDLTSNLTLIVGGRYTWDKLRYNFFNECIETAPTGCESLFLTGGTERFVSNLGPLSYRNDDSDWSGKAQVNYTIDDDVLAYFSVSKGLKTAGFTAPVDGLVTDDQIPFRAEKLYAYEGGIKSQFLDRKVTLNVGAYYYDYKDFQTFELSGTSSVVTNHDSKAYGGEVELTVRPASGLTASFGGAYNHFEVEGIMTPTAPLGGKQRPINAPQLQLLWGLSKSFDISDQLEVSLNYDGRYISKRFFNIVNGPTVTAPQYSLHDFSVRLDNKAGWFAHAYLSNAFDKKYVTFAAELTGLGYALRSFGETRTFSIGGGIRF